MLFNFPVSYIDRSSALSLESLAKRMRQEDLFVKSRSISSDSIDFNLRSEVTVIGEVRDISIRQIRNKKELLTVSVSDFNNSIARINLWNGIQYFRERFDIGQLLAISGKPELDKFGIVIFTHPEIDIIEPDDADQYMKGIILPKYRITEKMAEANIGLKLMRQIMAFVIVDELPKINETLPKSIIDKFRFPVIGETIKNLHFPESHSKLENSIKRAKFEEFFFYEMLLAVSRSKIKSREKGIIINPKSELARKVYDKLPFELTSDQKRVLREIAVDFESGRTMNRLLQGDVGTGKTIVSALSMLMAIEDGYQVAIMAPTEILAEQHTNTFRKFFDTLGIEIIRLTGSLKNSERNEALESISIGKAKVIVGTHALFQAGVSFNKLGMIVIDEQHRFGVAQRADLIQLAKESYGKEFSEQAPHVLVMSATPIPRTLEMTLYGDLDVSTIKEKPGNRQPVITKVRFESSLPDIYKFIMDEVAQGRQAYFVYPLVEKSEKLNLKSATEHFSKLDEDIFPGIRCGLLHGQMNWKEKEETMSKFLSKQYMILVSTTVIEVGIDVPDASVMVIENAERFGLSQLHQLRGRIGRGPHKSYCILVTNDKLRFELSDSVREEERQKAAIRLKTMEETSDGFKIAEADLLIRGPGDITGTKQSGIPKFVYADLVKDHELLIKARDEAFALIERDPHLRSDENKITREHFLGIFKGRRSYFDIA